MLKGVISEEYVLSLRISLSNLALAREGGATGTANPGSDQTFW
jgi:hypothetical protein